MCRVVLGNKSVFANKNLSFGVRASIFLSHLGFLAGIPPLLVYFLLVRTPLTRFYAARGLFLSAVFLGGLVFLGGVRWLQVWVTMPRNLLVVLTAIWLTTNLALHVSLLLLTLLGRSWRLPWIEPPRGGRA